MPNITGRAAFLQLLVDNGVTHLFGNPGTTELPIMEVVPQFLQLKYVLGLQESIVVGMADGFARTSGQLAACNLHVAPGLGHAMGALYSANFHGSPLIVTAGQYEQGHGLTEPLLAGPLVRMAEPIVKWAVEPTRIEDLPRILHRAAKIALTPPTGPVFISLPGDVLDQERDIDMGHPTRVEPSLRPSDATLDKLVGMLLAAKKPVIIAGQELATREAFNEAGEFATLLGASVYQEAVPFKAAFPSEHPLHVASLTRSQPQVRRVLEQFDLIVCLGADLLRMSVHSPTEPLPPDVPVVHISERDWELGKNYPTDLAIQANVKDTLAVLLPALRAKRSSDYAAQADRRAAELKSKNWSALRDKACIDALAAAETAPVDPKFLLFAVTEAIPKNAVIVDEGVTSTHHLAAYYNMRDPKCYYGLASGGLGFGMAGAIGASLAQPGRPIVAIVGDGAAMYSIQALWSAAHYKLPVTYVIANNKSYRIIKERLVASRKTDRFTGMDFRDPEIDFTKLARSMGVAAQRVTEPRDLKAAVQAAVGSGKPSLVDVVIQDGFSK
jgi:benzoylformate decarboxylase